MLFKYNVLKKWHEGSGTKDLFVFFTAKFFLPVQILLVFLKPLIIFFVGIGPGDVAFHPLNLTGSIAMIYLNLVGALVYVTLRKKGKWFSISKALWLIAAIQIVYLYVHLFFGLFGELQLSVSELLLTYVACSLLSYLFTLSIYLVKPSFWTKKAFKIQDMSVLLIAFFAISAKLISQP